jgi:hypothetical protein
MAQMPLTKVAGFPDTIGLNGMTVLDRDASLLLISDLYAGSVGRLHVNTGEASNVITGDPLMAAMPLGIDGVYVRDQRLYFTNFGRGYFGKVNLNADGTAARNLSLIVSGIVGDGFTFDANGKSFIADATNKIALVPPHGRLVDIAHTRGPTAAQFGRTALDSGSLYVATIGGDVNFEAGNATIGGSISRMNVEVRG